MIIDGALRSKLIICTKRGFVLGSHFILHPILLENCENNEAIGVKYKSSPA